MGYTKKYTTATFLNVTLTGLIVILSVIGIGLSVNNYMNSTTVDQQLMAAAIGLGAFLWGVFTVSGIQVLQAVLDNSNANQEMLALMKGGRVTSVSRVEPTFYKSG